MAAPTGILMITQKTHTHIRTWTFHDLFKNTISNNIFQKCPEGKEVDNNSPQQFATLGGRFKRDRQWFYHHDDVPCRGPCCKDDVSGHVSNQHCTYIELNIELTYFKNVIVRIVHILS